MNADKQASRHISGIRIATMIAAGVVAAAVTALFGQWAYAAAVGWAVACAVYITWVWVTISRMGGSETGRHAAAEDPSKTTSDTLLLIASIASLAALVLLLGQIKNASAPGKDLIAALGVASVALSWFFVHTLYTLRYAVLYYNEPAGSRRHGIDFNEDTPPRYLDFAYLAFTVGMTFQVSDTDISDQRIRAAILRHMLLSYLFGAVIIAATVNLVASLAS
ncbi:DUF1345 domain-containing protein [Leifsonia sp. NPDC056665]|uniref:DUF1345 domain-containing protein n=1 Tax=Leifsonia sp. NPDC056665 TaxID=3345901 RepID=UPI003697DA16